MIKGKLSTLLCMPSFSSDISSITKLRLYGKFLRKREVVSI